FGCYGNNENLTPNIDLFSKDAVICKNFYAAGSGSAPSHNALFSGQHPYRSGVVHNLSEIKKDIPSITKTLKKYNYSNFGKSQIIVPPIGYENLFHFDELIYPKTSSNHNEKIPIKKRILDELRKYPNLWTLIKKIFTKTFGTRFLLEQSARHFDGKGSFDYLLKKIEKYETNCFAYSTIFHPHTPYCPPKWVIEKFFLNRKVHEDAYSIQTDFHAWANGNYSNNEQAMIDLKTLYKGEVYYGDYLIGNFFNDLKKINKYDDSIIILTADHGEFFGEHNQINHGGTVYNEVIKVPCLIKFPKNSKNLQIIEKISSHVDIFPTIMEYLDIDISNLPLDGETIFKQNSNRNIVIDAPPLVLPGRLKHYPNVVKRLSFFWRSIINLEYKYVWKSDGSQYLYENDNFESNDNNIIDKKKSIANEMNNNMLNFYKNINANYKIDTYPTNIGKTAAKFITSPRIIRELKKEGYL
ncbi:sulfatase-like hydrolase/transferase, partial [Alphaproteobacteria bacterium]|nr:sulfatase-like hydrolase/transferase [Alphaproteobacteria bacterium]